MGQTGRVWSDVVSFDSFPEFLAMGGHGLYVWLSYGATLIVVLANVVSVRMSRQRFFRQARALERRRPGGSPGVGTRPAGSNQTDTPA